MSSDHFNFETTGIARRAGWLFCALLIAATTASARDLGDLNVSESRLPSWGPTRAGVQGGIPDTRNWPVFRRMSTGWSYRELQQAIDGAHAACDADAQCPDGGRGGYVVELPAETRDVNNGNDTGAIVLLRSNVVVRGQGPDLTKLRVDGPRTGNQCATAPETSGDAGSTFFVICGPWEGRKNVDLVWSGGGPAAGSDRFQLKTSDGDYNPADFQPGRDVIIVYTSNRSAGSPYMTKSVPSAELLHQFMATITSFDPPYITVDRKLRLDWSKNTPNADGANCKNSCYQVRPFEAIRNAGVEDLYIEGWHKGPIGGNPPIEKHDESQTASSLITVKAAKNVWIKNVTARWSHSGPIYFETSINSALVGSEVGPFLWGRCLTNATWQTCTQKNAGKYLVSLTEGASDLMITNNVLVGHPIGVRLRGGQNGNVISHNLHESPLEDFRPYTNQQGQGHGLVFTHGFYPHDNLIESNHSDGVLAMVADCHWGKNGPNAYYRNRASDDGGNNGFDNGRDETGWFKTESLGSNCSDGNVLIGNYAFAYTDSAAGNKYYTGGANPMSHNGIQQNLWFEFNVARDAVPNSDRGFNVASSTNDGLDCGLGLGTCPRSNDHTYGRNFEGPRAPASWDGYDVPPSLFFESVEDWENLTGATWCQEACGWDARDGIGAFGDDKSAGYCPLPAEIRFRGGICTPGAGSSSLLRPLPPVIY